MNKDTDDNESGSVVTPATKVAAFFSFLAASLAIALAIITAWLIATGAALYFSVTAENGTFSQSLAINFLAALFLIAIAPLVIDRIATNTRRYFFVFAAIATCVLFFAYITGGGLRDFLLNFGSGICLVLGVDYYVKHRFTAWLDKIDRENQELYKQDSHLVF